MDIQTAIALNKVINQGDLSSAEMKIVMQDMMFGEMTHAQIGGFLIALKIKGETDEEIAAAAHMMRDFATRVNVADPHLVDIVGTGGDGLHTFNVSTTAAFVIAAAGGKVAKHNNRSISSRSGSADVLEQAGVVLALKPEQIVRCINEVGVGYMFAPNHHPATRYAAGPRKELATRTIFNLLGPLTNPAYVKKQLTGVCQAELLDTFARVIQQLGGEHCMVVRAEDGMDEISNSSPTAVVELKNGTIKKYRITPEQFDIKKTDPSELIVNSPEQSHDVMMSVLDNRPGPALDIVLLNAGAAIYVADITTGIAEGVELARQVIAGGKARNKLEELIAFTQNPE